MNCVVGVPQADKDVKIVLHELYPRLCAFQLHPFEILRNPDGSISTENLEATDEQRLRFWNIIRAK